MLRKKIKDFAQTLVCNHLAQLSLHCASPPPSTRHPESNLTPWAGAEPALTVERGEQRVPTAGLQSPPLCCSSLLCSTQKQDGNLNQKGKLDLYNNLKITLYKAAKHIFLSAERKLLTRNTAMWWAVCNSCSTGPVSTSESLLHHTHAS